MSVNYYPILKAKQGELKALAEWDSLKRPDVHPVIEAVPWVRDDVSDTGADYDDSIEGEEVKKLAARLVQSWKPGSGAAYLDVAYAEFDFADPARWANVEPVLSRVMKQLAVSDANIAPVVRASADEAYLRRVRSDLTATFDLREAVIRITAEDLDDALTPLNVLARRAADAIGLRPQQVDVILDFATLADENATALATRLGRFVLPTLATDPWRSLAVASGAFPVNLSDVQAHDVERIPRHDLALWHSLAQLQLENAPSLSFGDYAATHPVLPAGTAFAAPPQLRYTQHDTWIVSKGRRQDRRGHQQFFDVCRLVLAAAGADASAPNASWGDAYIHDAAAQAGGGPQTRGPGNASTWRAIATSHHLAYTADQLNAGASS